MDTQQRRHTYKDTDPERGGNIVRIFLQGKDELKELLMPFIAGTFFIGAISSVVSYFFILYLLKRK
jgi:hypothetical protein